MTLVSLIGAIALAAAQPSQAEVGSKSEAKDVQAMHALAQCIVNERPAEVRALLATDFRVSTYGRDLRDLLDKRYECRGVSVRRGLYRSGTLMWGGALAEAIMRRDRTLASLAERTAYNPARPVIEARNAGEFMAFCAVRKDPARVATLLGTQPATAAEYQAIIALGATLSGCIPANTKSEFTREALRALLALGANRLAQHNAQAVR